MNLPEQTILDWLSSIINERISNRLSFIHHSGQLAIQCEGFANFIIFDAHQPDFYTVGHSIPFAKWNAESEGYSFPIDADLPAPGFEQLPPTVTHREGEDYCISYDIPGLIYWMLNRIEEIDSDSNDIHDRFPATASHAYKHDYLDRPIVDEWLDILRQVIQRHWPDLQLKTNKFSIKLSHDVDLPARYGFCSRTDLTSRILVDLKRGQVKNACVGLLAFTQAKNSIHKYDPFNTFDWLMDFSDQNGLTSTFNFICGKTDLQKDSDYLIDHESIRFLLKNIHDRGHEIGLHPSFNTYNDKQALINEANNLRRACLEERIFQKNYGGRMHYLRWQHPATLYALEEAGIISYDSSLGYADISGFRCGTCYEYPSFDPVNYKQLNIRIRPLIVMECSVILDQYMGLGYSDEAENFILSLRKKCEKVKGKFTMLWHNNYLITEQERSLYQSVIK